MQVCVLTVIDCQTAQLMPIGTEERETRRAESVREEGWAGQVSTPLACVRACVRACGKERETDRERQ